MNAGPSVLVVVSPNGLGHYRRCLGIFSRVKAMVPGLRLEIACTQFQHERLLAIAPELVPEVRFHFGVTDSAYRWPQSLSNWQSVSLTAWEAGLANLLATRRYDFVFSDNLVAPLRFRSDAVLIGSFLWHEVFAAAFPEIPEVAGFSAEERRYLQSIRPPMLCVGEFATPGVLSQTRAVPLGVMVDYWGDSPSLRAPSTVAVVGGGEGSASPHLLEAARGIAARSSQCLLIDPALTRMPDFDLAVDRYELFSFDRGDLQRCSAVVGRPGMGLVSECLAYGVPLVALYESHQFEMSHIARRLQTLGLGVDLRRQKLLDVSLGVEQALDYDFRKNFEEARMTLNHDGYSDAARWICDYLANRRD